MKKIFLLLFCAFSLNGCLFTPQQMAWLEGTVYLNPNSSVGSALTNGSLINDPPQCSSPVSQWPCSALNSGVVQNSGPLPGMSSCQSLGLLLNPTACLLPATCASLSESFQPMANGNGTFLGFQITPITTIVGTITNAITTGTGVIYNGIVGPSSGFQTILNITLTLYIVIYGIAIMFGIATPSPHEFIMRAVKFGVIVMFASPTGWSFFNNPNYGVTTFFQSLTNSLISIMICAFNPSPGCVAATPGSALLSIDLFLSRFYNPDYWRMPLAFFFSGWLSLNFGGVLVAILLVVMAVVYAIAVFHAVYLYIVALIAQALLFSVAPIFFIFLLFGHTRQMFEGWLKQLINFSLQPVFVFAFLAFFNGMITNILVGNGSGGGLLGNGNIIICYYQWLTVSIGSILTSSTYIGQFIGGVFGAIGGFIDNIIDALGAFYPVGTALYVINNLFTNAIVQPIISPICTSSSGVNYCSVGGLVNGIGQGFVSLLNWSLTSDPPSGASYAQQVLQGLANVINLIFPVFTLYWWRLFDVGQTFPSNPPTPPTLISSYQFPNNGFTQGPAYPFQVQGGTLVDFVANPAMTNLMPYDPISIASFFLVILLSFLMYKMGSWANDIAGQISEGLMTLPSTAPGGATIAGWMKGAAGGAAEMIGGLGGGGGGSGGGGSVQRSPISGQSTVTGGWGGGMDETGGAARPEVTPMTVEEAAEASAARRAATAEDSHIPLAEDKKPEPDTYGLADEPKK